MPPPVADHTGKRFGRLLAIAFLSEGRCTRWLCRCDCGMYISVQSSNLVGGCTRSCGCLRDEVRRTIHWKHGRTQTAEHVLWRGMIARCEYTQHKSFHNYGGRGIRVCRRWRMSFTAFLSDMGPRPSARHSLDRHPNRNGNYSPKNCRWALPREQGGNLRRNVYYRLNGVRLHQAEWARRAGLPAAQISARVARGWSARDAIMTPLRKCKRRS